MSLSLLEVIIFFVALINTLIVGFVLFKKPKLLSSQALFVMGINNAIWAIGFSLLGITETFGVFDKITLLGGVFMFFGFLFFTRVFPHNRLPKKKFWLSLIPLCFVSYGIVTNKMMTDVHFIDNVITPVNGPWFPLLALTIIGYGIVGITLLIQTYKKSQLLHRERMRYFFFGLFVFFACTIIFDVILPSVHIFKLNFIGPLSSIVLTFTTAYAIIRHQLMDIRIVIQRSLIYTILFAITLGIYIGLTLLLGSFFTLNTQTSAITSGTITMLAGFIGMSHLENLFQKITDRWFFKDRYNYSDALHVLSEVLNNNIKLDMMVHTSIQKLQKILKVANIHIYLLEDNLYFSATGKMSFVSTANAEYLSERALHPEVVVHSEINEMLTDTSISREWRTSLEYMRDAGSKCNVSVSAPIILDKHLLGILTMDNKRSGDMFTKEDLSLVKTFTTQAAVALEKSRLYEKVELHARDLEKKVLERTRKIQGLQKTQEQMIVDISHNLQTPLTILKSNIEKLNHNNIINTENFEILEESINRVSNFIYRLLQLSKSTTATKDTTFNLSNLLTTAIEYFTTVAEDQGITLTGNIENNIYMTGDPQQVEEALTNLVSNAIKYRRKDVPTTITITLSTNKEIQHTIITVEDNGQGISTDDLDNIFTRFYRACNDEGLCDLQGTGLGLAITKKIIEKYQGRILVKSIINKGSTFTIVLPLERQLNLTKVSQM